MRKKGEGMSPEKSKCPYAGCEEEPFGISIYGYCIFHTKAEEKTAGQFSRLLKNYIEKIKRMDLNYNFRGFVFVGDTDFERDFNISVFKNARFEEAEFRGRVSFVKTEFQGDTRFDAAKFYENAYFEGAEFQGNAYFIEAEFQGNTYFDGTKFQRDISSFDRAEIHEDACLRETKFDHTEFHGDAYFVEAKFANVYFLRAKFHGNARFIGTEFEGRAYFGGVDFRTTAYISPKFMKKEVSFVLANLENVSLTPLNLDKNACIYFTRARLRNTEIRREDIKNHIAQEKQKKLSEAKEVYLLLKNNFHSLGRYNDESWAFKKEKDMERKSYFQAHHRLKWFGSMFWHILYGYGERPFWILGWCGVLLFFSSFIYWSSKGVFQVMGTCLVPVEDYWNNLYFSAVTFSTLGYGDFRPIGKIKVFTSIEALLGIFFIALFIFTFARKTGGR